MVEGEFTRSRISWENVVGKNLRQSIVDARHPVRTYFASHHEECDHQNSAEESDSHRRYSPKRAAYISGYFTSCKAVKMCNFLLRLNADHPQIRLANVIPDMGRPRSPGNLFGLEARILLPPVGEGVLQLGAGEADDDA